MHIRPSRPDEALDLLRIFQAAVRVTAAGDYTAEQIEAWAPAAITAERAQHWIERIAALAPFVAEADGALVGYADLQADGYIDHFFVSPMQARRGVGAALMRHLTGLARERKLARVYADVSRTAQPFFARFGFEVLEQRRPIVRGVEVPNARMSKRLQTTAGLSDTPASTTPIEPPEVFALLVAACPSFLPLWDAHVREWGNHTLYLAAGDFAQHLLALQRQGGTHSFAAVAAVIERLLTQGDAEVQTLATVGILESIQNVWGNAGVDPEQFAPVLGPQGAAEWRALNAFWSGGVG